MDSLGPYAPPLFKGLKDYKEASKVSPEFVAKDIFIF
jgi:hypothetical protein